MPKASQRPRTLGELRRSPHDDSHLRTRSVRDELRQNLLTRLKALEPLFPGIIGYDDSVVPQIVNAILSRHNFILLGLRGQAKTRILRALTTLLDEAAFWLGALATGESGMTTELRVSLHRPAPFSAPVTVTGARGAVHQRGDDARYWETDVVARADGEVVATARITYVAVRGAARRLVTGMLAMNDPACVRRVFPAYTR